MSRAVHLTKQVPWPANSGGRIREVHVAAQLRRHFDEVHVLAFGPPPELVELPPGVHVHAFEGTQVVAGAARSGSLAVGRWHSTAMRRQVRALLRPGDHLHVGFPHMVVNAPSPARVDSLDLHNVESDLLAQRARSHPQRALRPLLAVEARRLAAWERRLAGTPVITCVSEQDRLRLAALGLSAVVAPNGTVLPPEPGPAAERADVVFVGTLDWGPNVEGVRWFCERVWPLVLARRPDARLQLVGRSPAPAVRALASASVEVVGDVPSVAPWYADARLAVCPLLAGGGSRLKVLEALAHGRPLVSTRLGAEGLEALDGHGLLLRDAPEALAAEIAALLGDPERCRALGAAGREAVARQWEWSRVLEPLSVALTTSRRAE